MNSTISKIKGVFSLLKNIDIDQLSQISQKVDLPKLIHQFSKLDKNQLNSLTKMLDSSGKKRELPPINGDFYELHLKLTDEQRAIQLKVREFMEKEAKPLVNRYWLTDDFPHELIPKFKKLNLCGVTYEGYGCPNLPFLMEGVIAMEIARVDASLATFFGVK